MKERKAGGEDGKGRQVMVRGEELVDQMRSLDFILSPIRTFEQENDECLKNLPSRSVKGKVGIDWTLSVAETLPGCPRSSHDGMTAHRPDSSQGSGILGRQGHRPTL